MRKQILLGALTVFGLALSMQATAQDGYYHCGTSQRLKKLYAENPQLEIDQEKLMEQYRTMEDKDGATRAVITIPIVFHIVHEYGAENISDAQVYDQMRILNEDFRMKNADTSEVIAKYDTIRADAQIEFRLATIDPFGNPTNGIEHIYSHQTNDGDDQSKINQWNRAKYLNVWVVKSIGDEGVAGYAYYPTSTNSDLFFADGILILHNYVGSIGTSNPYSSRALTHEIGHYLGLPHTWGSTNDPGVSCGDDGVNDTPITRGHKTCAKTDAYCNASIIENVQNFMEYSYCSVMYTKGQVKFMHNVLDQITSQRNNLYTAENLHNTGADQDPAPLAPPVADFFTTRKNICVGEQVTYKNASWKGAASSYSWTFPGGSPSTSTDVNPVVTYVTDGQYSATLTVTNDAGTSTKTLDNVTYVSPDWVENVGPDQETFNGVSYWFGQNPEGNFSYFHLVDGAGKDRTKCYELNNYRNLAGVTPYTTDYYYYSRLGGTKDYLVSESYDLSTTTNVQISFDYAYGTKATTSDEVTEVLNLYASKDCGKTWTILPAAKLEKQDLITTGYAGDVDFVPTNNNQWKTKTFAYTANSGFVDAKTRFRFEFVASDKSSNLFIDNFNVGGQLGITDNQQSLTAVSLSPNPVASGADLSVQIEETDADMQLQLVDLNGMLISTTDVSASNGTQTVKIPMSVAKGCYILQATQGAAKSTHRVIVF